MRARTFSVLALGFATACGGAQNDSAKNAKSGAGKNDDSIADQAAKNGGIAGLDPNGNPSSSGGVASSLTFQLLDPATPVKL
ncbi:MAG: hypothetical protein ABI461_22250, partial [Polyangiaceae bacterium]